MKTTPALVVSALVMFAVAAFTTVILTNVRSSYAYEKSYGQYWELADKQSTIAGKQKYLAQFVDSLEAGNTKGDFASHDAIWLQTPNNEFRSNVEACRTLSERLGEIAEMDPKSFEYNTAIQQITAQEQGEANKMIEVFTGCYELARFPLVWGWIEGTILSIAGACLLAAFAVACVVIE